MGYYKSMWRTPMVAYHEAKKEYNKKMGYENDGCDDIQIIRTTTAVSMSESDYELRKRELDLKERELALEEEKLKLMKSAMNK